MKVLPIDVVGGGLVFGNGVNERIAGARVLHEQAAHTDRDRAHFARVYEQKEGKNKSARDVGQELALGGFFLILFQTGFVQVPHFIDLNGTENKQRTHMLHVVEGSAADDGNKGEAEVGCDTVHNRVRNVKRVGEAAEQNEGCGVHTQHVHNEDVTAEAME